MGFDYHNISSVNFIKLQYVQVFEQIDIFWSTVQVLRNGNIMQFLSNVWSWSICLALKSYFQFYQTSMFPTLWTNLYILEHCASSGKLQHHAIFEHRLIAMRLLRSKLVRSFISPLTVAEISKVRPKIKSYIISKNWIWVKLR